MSSLSSLLGSSNTAAANSNAAAPLQPPDFECPSIGIRQGASTMSAWTNPAEQSALNLRYQVTIGQTARECRLMGTTVAMKVGMQGRVILGPAGAPGQIDVPIRLAVVKEGTEPKTVATKLQRLTVSIPPDDPNVLFTFIEDELTFPMPPGSEIDSYIVYLGFDPLAAKDERKRPAPRSARPRRPS
jgi:hypothetical protein